MPQNILILGASGKFGRHAHASLKNAGHNIRCFQRDSGDLNADVDWADIVVSGWHPSDYSEWKRETPKITNTLINALHGKGKRLIVAGNIYIYGSSSGTPWDANSPQLATNPLGKLRIQMEHALKNADFPCTIIRCGEFLDTENSGNWFDKIMISKLDKGVFHYPGPEMVTHSWAYLPDVGNIVAHLVEENEKMPKFLDIPFSGYTLTAQDWCRSVSMYLQRPVRYKKMSWTPIYLLSPFWPMARGLIEMGYLWSLPHSLDGTDLRQRLPDFKPTPLMDALPNIIKS
jgi:uncharacterized protein YbjT (DUF2867 family)